MKTTINLDLLKEALEKGWIKKQKHPDYNLYIYNYTPLVQYERKWNEITLACRGLILDEDYNIIARPFPKFFNWEELTTDKIPALNFEVYEKMDGSLGILYWCEGKPYIATRGSFSSKQAGKATEMLYGKYKNSIEKLDKTKTYVFEIIYPENRIVVNYGEAEELVLLAVLETSTGKEFPLERVGFPLVKTYEGITSLHELRNKEDNLREGFVVRFSNNFRMKVKFQEYLRLHRILTQISTVTIWEYMKNNNDWKEILNRVPDEFYTWVKEVRGKLEKEYSKIEEQSKKDFKILNTRKETAIYFMNCKNPKILFAMLDNRDYSSIIWKMLLPKYEKPFIREE